MITLTINKQEELILKEGTVVFDIVKNYENVQDIYACVVNGKLHDLQYELKESGTLSFIDKHSDTGRLVYERTLSFLFIAAVHSLFDEAHVRIEHTLSAGLYCEVDRKPFLTPFDVTKIKQRMHEIVEQGEVIHRKVVKKADAVAYFERIGMHTKADLLRHRESETSSIYCLCGVEDYFYGIMLPNTSYLTQFDIRYYAPGVWLSPQAIFHEQAKLFRVFQKNEAWGRKVGVSSVSQLNQKILVGKMDELVLMSETLIEKKLGEVAQLIVKEPNTHSCVLIAGPSSAGKTTFSKRLAIHLKILGMEPIAISMDDFYKNRCDTPKLPDGSYDFEALHAVDLELFNDIVLKLLHGESLRLPYYNFQKGKREWHEELTTLGSNEILIIEGIHGLNPEATSYIPEAAKFKIYINALTHLNLDDHNRIPTSDYRLIRRMVRDHRSRGRSADVTIDTWQKVRDGEDKYIYPYQEMADYIFNTSMVYELSILKKLAIPLLSAIQSDEAAYLEANRLKKLLAYFVDGDESAVPRSSILAEFIGNSVFDV